jgi:DNA-binding protein HU-beta
LSKKDILAVIDTAFDVMKAAIKKEKRFAAPDFGVFSVRKRSARTGRNPQTGEKIKIKATKTVAFKPAKAFKDKL